jgi:hypothetical protein
MLYKFKRNASIILVEFSLKPISDIPKVSTVIMRVALQFLDKTAFSLFSSVKKQRANVDRPGFVFILFRMRLISSSLYANIVYPRHNVYLVLPGLGQTERFIACNHNNIKKSKQEHVWAFILSPEILRTE